MNVCEGGPDVWYITRTWLIIGDGPDHCGCLMMMSVSGGLAVTMLEERGIIVKGTGRPYGGSPPSSGQMGNMDPSNELWRKREVLYTLWEFGSFSEKWLWSRKRCWPAIITPANLKLFRRKIWEQLFSFSANYLRHSEIIPFPTNSISEDDYHLEIKHSFEARCLLLFEFLWSTREGQCNGADPGDSLQFGEMLTPLAR